MNKGKNKVGRPKLDKNDADKARSYTASITPNEHAKANELFANIGEAIKWAIANKRLVKQVLRPAKRVTPKE